MSYTALDSIQWGGVPKIGVSFGYDSRRSGSAMQYRIYVTVVPLTGASYFGYPIYLSVTVDGGSVCSGHTLKAASPSRWSSAIEYDSGWVTVAGAVGTAPLGIRLYSGSGSARDDSYGYALPVERVEDIGDFSLTAGDAVIGQTGTLTLTRPGYGYSFTFSYVLGAAMEDTLGKAAALTGGYASSYAQSAGQQAYNGYLQELAALVPELRQAALAEYQQEGKALQNQYSMLDAQEKADYDRWQEARGDWQKQLEAAQAAYEDAGSQDQKLYQTLLAHFSDKAEQERKLSASGVRLTDSGNTGSRGESLSSTAAESLQRAVGNYLKRGNGDLAQALAAQYTARMTPAQRQRLEKLLGQYGMTLA
mgnify:CR=1 FL=1